MLLSHFWKRWTSEYLPTLGQRRRWTVQKKTPKIGDICLIAEDKTARPTWPLGRVTETISGKDGIVRTFRLKTAKGIVTRPIQKLHLLEESKEEAGVLDEAEFAQRGQDIPT